MLYKCVSRAAIQVRMWGRVAWSHAVWWNFLGRVVGGSASMIDVCWYSLREFHVGW